MKKASLLAALNFLLIGAGASACPTLDIEQVNSILQIHEFSDSSGTWELQNPDRTDYQYPLDKSVHLDEKDHNLSVVEPTKKGEHCLYTVLFSPMESEGYVVGRFVLHKALKK